MQNKMLNIKRTAKTNAKVLDKNIIYAIKYIFTLYYNYNEISVIIEVFEDYGIQRQISNNSYYNQNKDFINAINNIKNGNNRKGLDDALVTGAIIRLISYITIKTVYFTILAIKWDKISDQAYILIEVGFVATFNVAKYRLYPNLLSPIVYYQDTTIVGSVRTVMRTILDKINDTAVTLIN